MVFTTLISIVSVSSSQLFTTYGNHWIAVDALHLCGILSHYSDKSSWSSIIFFAIFSRLYICCISQTCSTWVMTGDNSYQECHSTWKNSCPCLAVSRWSINVLLTFNQATSNGIWGILHLKRNKIIRKKHKKVIFLVFRFPYIAEKLWHSNAELFYCVFVLFLFRVF